MRWLAPTRLIADLVAAGKLVGPPGSTRFLLACTVVGLFVAHVWPRKRRLGYRALGAIVGAYGLLSLPVVSGALSHELPDARPADLQTLHGLDLLFVLDGDNRDGRVREMARLYRAESPTTVWVIGDRTLLEQVLDAHIPQRQIAYHYGEWNTRAQMARVEQVLDAMPGARSAIVTSRLQMPRIEGLAACQGLSLVFAPSPVDVEPPTSGLPAVLPNRAALAVSRDALYEQAALFYYDWRGWTRR